MIWGCTTNDQKNIMKSKDSHADLGIYGNGQSTPHEFAFCADKAGSRGKVESASSLEFVGMEK